MGWGQRWGGHGGLRSALPPALPRRLAAEDAPVMFLEQVGDVTPADTTSSVSVSLPGSPLAAANIGAGGELTERSDRFNGTACGLERSQSDVPQSSRAAGLTRCSRRSGCPGTAAAVSRCPQRLSPVPGSGSATGPCSVSGACGIPAGPILPISVWRGNIVISGFSSSSPCVGPGSALRCTCACGHPGGAGGGLCRWDRGC